MFTKLITKINKNNEIEAQFKIYKGNYSDSNKFKEESNFKVLNGVDSIKNNNNEIGLSLDSSFYSKTQLKDLHYYSKFLSFLDSHNIEYINVNDGFNGSKALKNKNIRIFDCLIYNNGLNQCEFKYKSKLIEAPNNKPCLFLDYSEVRSFQYFNSISNYKLIIEYNNVYYMVNGTILKKYIDMLKEALDSDYYNLYAIRIPVSLFTKFESIQSLNKKVRINKSIVKEMIDLHKQMIKDFKNNSNINYYVLPCERSFCNQRNNIA
jgi:hypothetical protein